MEQRFQPAAQAKSGVQGLPNGAGQHPQSMYSQSPNVPTHPPTQPPSNHHAMATAYLQPNTAQTPLRIAPLDLGFHPSGSASQTSLLEAVVGPNQQAARHSPKALPTPPKSRSKASSFSERRTGSDESKSYGTSFGTSTEREWDVLSDASLRLNEGEVDEEAVQELEKKVNKRRSNLPHLESQLAALEAKIKAAEERLARAQATGGQAAPDSTTA